MPGFDRHFPRWLHKGVQALGVVCLLLAALPGRANELAQLSGLWVVDVPATVAVWQSAGRPMDKGTQKLLSAYRIRVDFAARRMEEGIIIGGGAQRNDFDVAMASGGRFTLTIKSQSAKVFEWQLLDGERAIVAVKGAKDPPLAMRRDTLSPFSGVWRFADVEAVAAALEKTGKKNDEALRQQLANVRLVADFEGQMLTWKSRRRGKPVYEGLKGGFVVSGRNGDTVLSFGKGTLIWRAAGKDRVVITSEGMTMTLVKEADLPLKR